MSLNDFLDCEAEFAMYFNAYKPIGILWSFPLRILGTCLCDISKSTLGNER